MTKAAEKQRKETSGLLCGAPLSICDLQASGKAVKQADTCHKGKEITSDMNYGFVRFKCPTKPPQSDSEPTNTHYHQAWKLRLLKRKRCIIHAIIYGCDSSKWLQTKLFHTSTWLQRVRFCGLFENRFSSNCYRWPSLPCLSPSQWWWGRFHVVECFMKIIRRGAYGVCCMTAKHVSRWLNKWRKFLQHWSGSSQVKQINNMKKTKG